MDNETAKHNDSFDIFALWYHFFSTFAYWNIPSICPINHTKIAQKKFRRNLWPCAERYSYRMLQHHCACQETICHTGLISNNKMTRVFAASTNCGENWKSVKRVSYQKVQVSDTWSFSHVTTLCLQELRELHGGLVKPKIVFFGWGFHKVLCVGSEKVRFFRGPRRMKIRQSRFHEISRNEISINSMKSQSLHKKVSWFTHMQWTSTSLCSHPRWRLAGTVLSPSKRRPCALRSPRGGENSRPWLFE